MLDNPPSQPRQLLIGTYTEELPHVNGKAAGILACAFTNGSLGAPVVASLTRNPSWVVVTSSGTRLYAVNETTQFDGAPGGGVTAFARDPSTGALTTLNSVPSTGVEPAYIALDISERFVIVANYRSGSIAVFGISDDGSLAGLVDRVQHSGHSSHPVRQSGPHPHMLNFDPTTGDLLVPDLGLDAVLVYELDGSGHLTEKRAARISTRPGAGPRHIAFHPDRSSLFVLNELDNTLIALRREGSVFEITDIQSTLPAGFLARSQAAAVRVLSPGRYIYATNRGHESLAVFEYEAERGSLQLVNLIPVAGEEPRDFCISPDGGHVLVANQNSGTIVTFAIDEDGASLNQISVAEVPTPVCLVFAP